MRISSLLILVGVGSFLCYRLIFGKKQRQEAETLTHGPKTTTAILSFATQEGPGEKNSPGDWRQRIANWSSTPSDRRQSLESESSVQEEDSTFLRSFSMGSNNGSIFGDQTVAKLDLLLNQIQDIKKSVGEMDAELMTTGKNKFLRLTAVDDSSDANETSPPSPTLEWDSNDINDITLYNDEHPTPDQEEENGEINPGVELDKVIPVTRSESADKRLHLQLPLNQVTESESPPSPSSSSGKGSMASSPDEKLSKEKRVHDILSEARRLGVLNDLLDALLETAKRDSAFFEN